MFCPNCGNEIDEGAKFCGVCGTPVGENEQTQSVAAEPVMAAPVVAEPVETAGETAAPILTGSKRRGRSLILAAAVLVVLVVGTATLLPKLFSGGKGRCVYLNGDDEMMGLKSLNGKADGVRFAKNGVFLAQFSPDGKYFYYYNTDQKLYRITASQLGKKECEPEKIDSDVDEYKILPSGKVVLTRATGSGDYQLRLFDGKDSYKLTTTSDGYSFDVDDKEQYVYFEDSSEGEKILYRMALKDGSQKEKLLKNYEDLYNDWTADVLVYSKDAEYKDGLRTFDLYAAKSGEKGERLVKEVSGVFDVSVNGGKVSFMYYAPRMESRPLSDYFTDKLAASDAAAVEPKREDYGYTGYNPYWGGGPITAMTGTPTTRPTASGEKRVGGTRFASTWRATPWIR